MHSPFQLYFCMRFAFPADCHFINQPVFFFVTDEKYMASPTTVFIIILSLEVAFFKRSGTFLKASGSFLKAAPKNCFSVADFILNGHPFAIFRGSLTGELLENTVKMTETCIAEHI